MYTRIHRGIHAHLCTLLLGGLHGSYSIIEGYHTAFSERIKRKVRQFGWGELYTQHTLGDTNKVRRKFYLIAYKHLETDHRVS